MGACYIWPLPGLGVQEFINPEDNPRVQAILEGQEPDSPKVDKATDEENVKELSTGSSDKL